ncbi:MAG TPA: hypothetical protein VF412_06315 [Bdellovibrio sp.]|uniref:hypothetical protein n=1 Tax=Bdellovibrio sp. TaxID=28201 RepID=UPI002EFDFB70
MKTISPWVVFGIFLILVLLEYLIAKARMSPELNESQKERRSEIANKFIVTIFLSILPFTIIVCLWGDWKVWLSAAMLACLSLVFSDIFGLSVVEVLFDPKELLRFKIFFIFEAIILLLLFVWMTEWMKENREFAQVVGVALFLVGFLYSLASGVLSAAPKSGKLKTILSYISGRK